MAVNDLGLTELIAEVRACIGRENDTTLITDERIKRWLDKAQEDIAERVPNLNVLEFKNTDSVDFTAGKLAYDLKDWTSPITTPVGGTDSTETVRVCYMFGATFSNGSDSVNLQYLPTDQFDAQFPDPTHSDSLFGRPEYYTRRGNNIEIYPVCSTAEDGIAFRLDGQFYPADFTSTDSTAYSTLERADDILIAYAVFKAWAYIGTGDEAAGWLAKYTNLLDNYKNRNDVMHEWDANVYGPFI
jgi:hypothetical protein